MLQPSSWQHQALSQVETDVKALVEGFDAALVVAEKSLLADIEKTYSGGKKYLTELTSYKKSISIGHDTCF